jgi:hypothetical protein
LPLPKFGLILAECKLPKSLCNIVHQDIIFGLTEVKISVTALSIDVANIITDKAEINKMTEVSTT